MTKRPNRKQPDSKRGVPIPRKLRVVNGRLRQGRGTRKHIQSTRGDK